VEKSVTVPGKCYPISDGDRAGNPKYKLEGCGYGLLPKQEVWIAPWEEVPIDLIGQWKVKVNGQPVKFNALTCIDTASNLVELIRIDNKTAKHIPDKFTQSWLCQYPCPV
jgi:hypothetical protein